MKAFRSQPPIRGLFGRLFLIFIALVMAIGLAFAFGFHLFNKQPFRKIIASNIKNYAEYIKKDIGTPPNIERAKKIAQEYGLSIALFGPGLEFRSNKEIPSKEVLLKLIEHHEVRGHRRGEKHFRRLHFIYLTEGDYKYFFAMQKSNIQKSLWPLFISVLLSLLFVAIAYHRVQKLFSPLHEIKEAAGQYAKGNFDYQFGKEGSGLLADLSQSIQEMGEKIELMLNSKRELLLAIAHELRTPLTRAKLLLEFIEDSQEKQKLGQEVDEISGLITDLLESERLQEGHAALNLEPCNLAQLIEDIVEQNFSDKEIKLKLSEKVEKPVDCIRFAIVIKNLISNAIQYGENKPIEVFLSEDYFSVVDHGVGLAKEDITKVTEAFYRVNKGRERSTGGVGLGLYLVAQITRAHGFELEITSENKTEFKVKF